MIEAAGRSVLFDTGAHPMTVLNNADALGIDLGAVEHIVYMNTTSPKP